MGPKIYDGLDGVYGENSIMMSLFFKRVLIIQTAGVINIFEHWYHNQNEHTNNNYQPKAAIKADQASSNKDTYGVLLFSKKEISKLSILTIIIKKNLCLVISRRTCFLTF